MLLTVVQHGSCYSAEFIFPDFSGQNASFSPTNLFTWNTNISFQAFAVTKKQKRLTNLLRVKRAEIFFYNSSKFFLHLC